MQFINNMVNSLLARIQDAREEAGQTLVEYGLILALISIVAIVALGLIGGSINDVFTQVSNVLNGTTSPTSP